MVSYLAYGFYHLVYIKMGTDQVKGKRAMPLNDDTKHRYARVRSDIVTYAEHYTLSMGGQNPFCVVRGGGGSKHSTNKKR